MMCVYLHIYIYIYIYAHTHTHLDHSSMQRVSVCAVSLLTLRHPAGRARGPRRRVPLAQAPKTQALSTRKGTAKQKHKTGEKPWHAYDGTPPTA